MHIYYNLGFLPVLLQGFYGCSILCEVVDLFFRKPFWRMWTNGPSLMSHCLQIILVIGSCVTFGGLVQVHFRNAVSTVFFFLLVCSFNFALTVLFILLTSFIICQAILDCLSSTESLILSIWFCIYYVCSFRYMPANWCCAFLVFEHLCLLDSSYSFGGSFQVYSFFSQTDPFPIGLYI